MADEHPTGEPFDDAAEWGKTPRRDLAAVVRMIAESSRRTTGDSLERWPYAIRVDGQPDRVSRDVIAQATV